MTLTKKIAQNTGFHIFGRILQLAISAITVMVLTRYLGPTDYGIYALIIAFIGLFSDVSGLGLNMLTAREMPNLEKKASQFFTTALGLKAICSIVLFSTGFIVGFFLYPNSVIHWGMGFAAISSFFLAIQVTYQPIFQIKLKIYNFVWADIISRLVGFGVLILFIFQGYGIEYIIATMALSSFLNWLITDLSARRIFRVVWKIDWSAWKKLLITVLPLTGFAIFNGMIQKIGLIILSKIDGAEAVGIYQLALQPILILGGFSWVFLGFVYPLLAKYHQTNKEKLLQIYKKSTQVLINLSLLLSTLIFILNGQIISILGGVEFMASKTVLAILVFVLLFKMIAMPNQAIALAIHREKSILYIYLTGFLLVIIASFFLIPQFGAIGAAWALLISYAFLMTAIGVLVKEYVSKLEWGKIAKQLILPVIIMGVLTWLISQTSYFQLNQFSQYNIGIRICLVLALSLFFTSPFVLKYRNQIISFIKP